LRPLRSSTLFTPLPGRATIAPSTAVATPVTLIGACTGTTCPLLHAAMVAAVTSRPTVAGSPNTSYLQWTYVGAGVSTRTWTVTMPTTPGTYEFRLLLNNGFTRAATSPTVTTISP